MLHKEIASSLWLAACDFFVFKTYYLRFKGSAVLSDKIAGYVGLKTFFDVSTGVFVYQMAYP